MSDTVSLTVGGHAYSGWKSVRVTRGIDAVASAFSLSVSERWSNQQQAWPIREGDACVVSLGEDRVIEGYVDRRSLAFSASSHSVSVEGRDKTGDLVDCSALLDKWEFRNLDVLAFAKKVCAPYGITVSLQAGLVLAKPKKLSINPGDTAFDAIEHACRLSGVLAVSDGNGGLLLTRAGTARCKTELVQGQNILAASAEFDASGRFYTYAALGQHHGSDGHYGSAAAQTKGTATDTTISRTARTLLIRPEHDVTTESAKQRAQWEATVRAARGDTVTVTVQGWRQGDGTLWPINAMARVKLPELQVDGTLLISSAVYSLDDGGSTTQLTLKPPSAFLPKPEIVKSTNYWKEIERGV